MYWARRVAPGRARAGKELSNFGPRPHEDVASGKLAAVRLPAVFICGVAKARNVSLMPSNLASQLVGACALCEPSKTKICRAPFFKGEGAGEVVSE